MSELTYAEALAALGGMINPTVESLRGVIQK